MEKHLFDRLVESTTQRDEIDRGERQPSRGSMLMRFRSKVRQTTGLSQASFAKALMLH